MLPLDIETVNGFLDAEEGERLYRHALQAAPLGPIVEIGSYCGKSTVYLGSACQQRGQVLYAVDHHSGSEEHQPGEEYHDSSLFCARFQRMDSFPVFRDTLRRARLESTVVPIVAPSAIVAMHWRTPLGMVFIDGGHSAETAQADYDGWAHHVISGGLLVIHDVFPNPADGGRPPFDIWQKAQSSGLFKALPLFKTLGALIRV